MMRAFAKAALCAAVLLAANARADGGEEMGDVYTYPVKSVHLQAAGKPKWYGGYANAIEDAHGVEGTSLRDASGKHAGYVVCGKGMQSERSSLHEAFAFRVDASGKMLWTWKSNVKTDDVANAVAQLPAQGGKMGDILVVGFRIVNSVAKRSITKLNGVTGKEMWTLTFGDTKKNHGALEMISLSADGNHAYVSGLYKKPTTQEMAFKSYGNCPGGRAVATKLKVSVLQSDSKPSLASAVVWTATFPSNLMSAKDIAELPVSGNIAVMLWTEEGPADVAVSVIRASDGSSVWSKYYPDAHAEPTDIDVHASADGKKDFIVMTGHGGKGKGISGRLVKIAGSSGQMLWAKSFSAGGTPELIYNECWGVAAVNGGYVMGCGTGIEGCSHISSSNKQLKKDCANGIGDKRPGAYPRKPGIWQSMVIFADFDGNLQWQRVDSYKAPGSRDMGKPGWLNDADSSACEWIMANDDKSSVVALNDEAFGVGLLAIDLGGGDGEPTPTPFPTRKPTKAPTAFDCSTLKQRACKYKKNRDRCMWVAGVGCSERAPTPFPTRKPTKAPTVFSCADVPTKARCRWKKYRKKCVWANNACAPRTPAPTSAGAHCRKMRARLKCVADDACDWQKPTKKFGRHCVAASV